MIHFIRALLAKSVFKIITSKDLILGLQSYSSLRKICGFTRFFRDTNAISALEKSVNKKKDNKEEPYELKKYGAAKKRGNCFT